MGFADLHLHTNHSDGQYSPTAVVDRCVLNGLQALSIVDHDDVSALDEAMDHGRRKGIEVISGVELSVTWEGYDLHILGYSIDRNDVGLTKYLALFKMERIQRAKKIVEKLQKLGVPVSFEAVEKKAGAGTIGRPHIAKLLVEKGLVTSFQEAFDRFLGDGRAANVDKYKIDLENALKLIRNAGGISVIAHPGLQLEVNDIEKLVDAGVDGIEVIHPTHDEEQVQYYRKLAYDHHLLETGGSDFHGGRRGESAVGRYKIPYEWLAKMKRYVEGIRKSPQDTHDY